MKGLLVLSLAALSGVAHSPDTWVELGRQGAVHFVEVAGDTRMGADVYHRAIADVCGMETICIVHFWKDRGLAASHLPMTAKQLHDRAALWQYNGNTGRRALLWNCGTAHTPDCLPD